MTPGSRIASSPVAAIAAVVSLALAGVVVYVLWNDTREIQRGLRMVTAALFAFPLVVVPALLLPSRTRPLGFSLATAIAAIALLGAAVSLFFTVAWSGFGREASPIVAFAALVGVLFVVGIVGYRSIDRESRSPGHWLIATVVAIAYVQFAYLATNQAKAYYSARSYAATANDLQARELLERWVECAAALAAGGRLPASSEALVAEGCALPALPGHALRYIAGPPGDAGRPRVAMACATPIDWTGSGYEAFVALTSTGVQVSDSSVKREPACIDATRLVAPGAPRMAFCLIEHFKATGRIAETLLALAKSNPQCLAGLDVGAVWAESSQVRVTYVTGIGSGGFTVIVRPMKGDAVGFDGTWKATAGSGIADMVAVGAPPAPRMQPEWPRHEEIEPKCTAGDANACYVLGNQIAGGYAGRTKDRAAGTQILEKSCAMGSGAGCQELAYQSFRDQPQGIASIEEQIEQDRARLKLYLRACQLDHAAGCADAAAILKRGKRMPDDVAARYAQRAKAAGEAWKPPIPIDRDPVQALALLRRGCGLGYDTACTNLSESLLEQATEPSATREAIEALAPFCARGDSGTCHRMASILRASGPFQDLPRARDLFFATCDISRSHGCKEAAELWPAVQERGAIVADLTRERR